MLRVPNAAPSASRSSFRSADDAGGSERRKTFGSAVRTWKCFPKGRKQRKARTRARWSQ